MSPADRRQAQVAALRCAITRLERELAAVRAALRRAELAARVRLHRGHGIAAPPCQACGGPTYRFTSGRACRSCGQAVRAEAVR